MKERNNNQEEIVHQLPPAWCGSICRNAMSEMCVEHCAIERDTSYFEPKPNLNLSEMPRFPDTKNMSREEKFASVTIYLAKVVDHLQGVEHGTVYIRTRRPDLNRERSIEVLENIPLEDLQLDSKE